MPRMTTCFRILTAAVVALAAATGATPVAAHPHIWIDVDAAFNFEAGKIKSISFRWALDDFFSAGVIGAHDKDRNRKLDKEEQKDIKANAFEGAKASNFFTDIRFNNDRFKIETTTGFAAEIKKGQVIYRFTVPFDAPVDPSEQAVSLSIYDRTFFVDITFVKDDPIRLVGSEDGSCHFILDEDRDNPIYYGVVFPQRVDLLCGTK